MKGLICAIALVAMLAAGDISAQNGLPVDSTGRSADSLTPAAPKTRPPISKAIGSKLSEEIPPDTVAIPYDREPKMISQGQAEYPRLAQAGRFTGTVTVKAFVDSTGTVRKAEAIKCNRPGMGFEEAAVKSAHKSTFEPAMYKGKPVGIWFKYEVNFE
jgi:TonB family protein